MDATTGEPLRTSRSHLWSIAWRNRGDGSFRTANAAVDVNGQVELELPVGLVDLAIRFADEGFAPRQVLGIAIREGGDDELTVELERGLEAKLEFAGDEPLDGLREHLVFALHESELSAVRGPFADQGGASNHRINGRNMWLAEPGLMTRLIDVDALGVALLRGLTPGHCSLVAFPDDLVFEPSSFAVERGGDEHATRIAIRWRHR